MSMTLKPWISLLLPCMVAGCARSRIEPELVYGERGVQGGQLVKPRAIAIDHRDRQDRIYLVDWTVRFQAFDRNGKFLDVSWTTPNYRNGPPWA